MYRGGNKDMKTKSSTLTAIGTILVKAYLDEKIIYNLKQYLVDLIKMSSRT